MGQKLGKDDFAAKANGHFFVRADKRGRGKGPSVVRRRANKFMCIDGRTTSAAVVVVGPIKEECRLRPRQKRKEWILLRFEVGW
jgi:hypothetical protein